MSQAYRTSRVRYIAMTGILSAIATVLMMLSFSVPFMPSFIKLDFSELPALIASFSMGPMSGVMVCLIKNLINLPMTTTGGVGELSNFLLGVFFVWPAGVLYHMRSNRRMALIASLVGAFTMALMSLPSNYYLTYPVYANLMPLDLIIGAYQAIVPGVDGLFQCLLFFNVPFTLLKGLLDTALTFLVYKRLSPLIKGKRN
ncbi:MAG: ECF transporter S component [Clostridia bacterium]|nr:ECF transporter S component [Clostridia bacterium]